MTPQDIEQVRASFAKVAPIGDQAAALFYGRLFETAPDVRALFKDDMEAQGRKLMTAIATVVDGLDDIAAIAPAVGGLAERHVGYGVRPEHYRWSAPRCCGPWSKGWAAISRPPSERRGSRLTAPFPT